MRCAASPASTTSPSPDRRTRPGSSTSRPAERSFTGQPLGSASAVADSKQTLLCTYLSVVLLVGLLANSLLGWTWADPIAALVIAVVAVKDGREAWRGDGCCAPTGLTALKEADGATP